jgi:small nuclear ribonucleoprotein (snRNP)-like protein
MATGLTIDFAQQFIEKVGKEELGLSLENMILSRDYPIGNHVKVQFNYLNGTTDESIIGNISKTGDIIVTKRVLSRSHQHSTPDLILEEGDLMEVHFSYGSWTIHYKFFSSLSGELIGEKVKIITPLDFIYRGRIRGFDMGMTLQKLSDGTVTSDIDNSVSDMVKRGMISKSLDAKLGEVSRVAMEMLKAGNDSIVIRLDQ